MLEATTPQTMSMSISIINTIDRFITAIDMKFPFVRTITGSDVMAGVKPIQDEVGRIKIA